jgi:hypothetical protein
MDLVSVFCRLIFFFLKKYYVKVSILITEVLEDLLGLVWEASTTLVPRKSWP